MKKKKQSKKKIEKQPETLSATVYLAGGCFWGTEHFFKQVRGVIKAQSGFVNGHTPNPTYKQVSTGTTGYAECVALTYDPTILSFKKILTLFFKTIDPTSLNKQGDDVGTQYRTGIYYIDAQQQQIAQSALKRLAKSYTQPIVVECEPFRAFYPVESWQNDYLDKFPNAECHIAPEVLANAKMANPISLSGKRHSIRKMRKKL